MGLFGKAGAWLKGVFGGSGNATPSHATHAQIAASAAPAKPLKTPRPMKPVAPAYDSHPSIPPTDPVRQSWERLKSFVARCEAEDLDLAGLRIEDPIGFWSRHARIECAKLRGIAPEQAVVAEGLTCLDHWVVVEKYFQARYSELVRLPNGKLTIRFVDAFQRTGDQAERAIGEERARLEAEIAEREPIGGVSLERFAEISAALNYLGSEATRARTTEVLAAFGLGAATFGSVRRGWEARMAADKTRRLRRAYRAAWTQATEMFGTRQWEVPTSQAPANQEVSKVVQTRYTWVESVEARPEYRSSLMTG